MNDWRTLEWCVLNHAIFRHRRLRDSVPGAKTPIETKMACERLANGGFIRFSRGPT